MENELQSAQCQSPMAVAPCCNRHDGELRRWSRHAGIDRAANCIGGRAMLEPQSNELHRWLRHAAIDRAASCYGGLAMLEPAGQRARTVIAPCYSRHNNEFQPTCQRAVTVRHAATYRVASFSVVSPCWIRQSGELHRWSHHAETGKEASFNGSLIMLEPGVWFAAKMVVPCYNRHGSQLEPARLAAGTDMTASYDGGRAMPQPTE